MNTSHTPSPEGSTGKSGADLLIEALAAQKIDYFFGCGGSDFAPVVEALARARKDGLPAPRPMVVPHETPAIALAHGAYLMTGRAQAVMVHVNVGTANTINVVFNAYRDNVPILLLAGRTPISETGCEGTRNGFIHWPQEMFDQGGMIRECVKWDYELRRADQAADAVSRGMELAMASPRGPVYLTLPRDVIAASTTRVAEPPRAAPIPPYPNPDAIARLAGMIASAQRPLIVAANAGRSQKAVDAIASLSGSYAIPVVSHFPRTISLPSSHPMHLGYTLTPHIQQADLILALECDVPWIPERARPAPDCRIVHIGEDPAFASYPMRSFRSDLSITAVVPDALAALEKALRDHISPDDGKIGERRDRVAKQSADLRATWAATEMRLSQEATIKPEWLSRCISDAIPENAVIFNEYPLRLEHCPRERADSYFLHSSAGGLGWGLGAALGAKLACPDRFVVSTVGDGSYIFANPTACHWLSAAYDLPVLTVIFNNKRFGAVRNATLDMYGQGEAARNNPDLLAGLEPSPDFEKVVEASGGFGVRVERPRDLPEVLKRAVEVVSRERRQAVVNVICDY